MLKKLTAVLFMMTFLTTLSACSLFGTEIDFGASNKTVITIWMDDGDSGEWSTKLIEAFQEENPDIRVKFNSMGSVDTRQQMETNGPAGLGADVFIMPHDHIGAALESGLLLPIGGKYADNLKDRIFPEGLNTVSVCYDLANSEQADCNGKNEYIFAAPISGESLALFYNKDILLAETGSDKPAATFEDIFNKAKTYNDLSNSSELKLWFAYDVGNAYDAHWIATAHGYDIFGEDHNDPDKINYTSPEMVAALAKVRQIRQESLNLTSDTTTLNGTFVKSRFENGQIAYVIDGPWSIQRYIDAGLNFGVVKLPTLNGKQPYTFSGVQVAAIYRGTTKEKQIAALKLIDFMTSVEGMQIMYDERGALPALKDVSKIEGLADDQYLRGINEQLAFSQPMPIIPEMGYFWSTAGTMYGNAWNGIVNNANGDNTNADGHMTPQQIAAAVAESSQNGYNALRGLNN